MYIDKYKDLTTKELKQKIKMLKQARKQKDINVLLRKTNKEGKNV